MEQKLIHSFYQLGLVNIFSYIKMNYHLQCYFYIFCVALLIPQKFRTQSHDTSNNWTIWHWHGEIGRFPLKLLGVQVGYLSKANSWKYPENQFLYGQKCHDTLVCFQCQQDNEAKYHNLLYQPLSRVRSRCQLCI